MITVIRRGHEISGIGTGAETMAGLWRDHTVTGKSWWKGYARKLVSVISGFARSDFQVHPSWMVMVCHWVRSSGSWVMKIAEQPRFTCSVWVNRRAMRYVYLNRHDKNPRTIPAPAPEKTNKGLAIADQPLIFFQDKWCRGSESKNLDHQFSLTNLIYRIFPYS